MDVCSASFNFISYADRKDRRCRSSQTVCVVLHCNSSLAESSNFSSREASIWTRVLTYWRSSETVPCVPVRCFYFGKDIGRNSVITREGTEWAIPNVLAVIFLCSQPNLWRKGAVGLGQLLGLVCRDVLARCMFPQSLSSRQIRHTRGCAP